MCIYSFVFSSWAWNDRCKCTYGPLWCDEGVYRIAKEIQLLKRIEFQNIFLGIGGFLQKKKVVLAAIETGPNISVMSGGHYVRSKRGKLDVINIRILAFKKGPISVLVSDWALWSCLGICNYVFGPHNSPKMIRRPKFQTSTGFYVEFLFKLVKSYLGNNFGRVDGDM